MIVEEVKRQMNEWSAQSEPFIFVIDLEQKKPLLFKLSEINSHELLYEIQGKTNAPETSLKKGLAFSKSPLSMDSYKPKFQKVLEHIQRGDTYLLNLTCITKIEIDRSLRELFFLTEAKYKLWLKDQFLVFSPESFVRIADDRISAYPMKGTIAADLPHAEATLQADEKELAEHYTIVDLIRNDLSMVAEDVRVDRFRYVDRLRTNQRDLLQVSSVITGTLPTDYRSRLGDFIFTLLPAGSVTGAPKRRTLEIIRDVEGEDRGYYTGVFGVFDGETLDSGVMIRFIEETKDGYVYRSGGGITASSDVRSEYEEMIDKVYVPLR